MIHRRFIIPNFSPRNYICSSNCASRSQPVIFFSPSLVILLVIHPARPRSEHGLLQYLHIIIIVIIIITIIIIIIILVIREAKIGRGR